MKSFWVFGLRYECLPGRPDRVNARWFQNLSAVCQRVKLSQPDTGSRSPKTANGGADRQEGMAGTTGLEPATSDVTGRRSNQLSYVPAGRKLFYPSMPAIALQKLRICEARITARNSIFLVENKDLVPY
jgi:hypothetical protein